MATAVPQSQHMNELGAHMHLRSHSEAQVIRSCSAPAAHLLKGGAQLHGCPPELVVVAAAARVAVRSRQVAIKVDHRCSAVGVAGVLEARRKAVDLGEVPARTGILLVMCMRQVHSQNAKAKHRQPRRIYIHVLMFGLQKVCSRRTY